MKRFWRLLFVVLLASCSRESAIEQTPTGHFFYGQPLGTPASNNLIERKIYALSSNDDRKMADWVCYRLDMKTVNGNVKTSRRWKADPLLADEETLEPEDYKGAFATLNTDRGHQAPLASFKGTTFWQETNYLSNITPQKSDLNQGPWRILEERVRDLVQKGQVVWVMTGPLYEREMPFLPGADEPHQIPSGYWKIVCVLPTEDASLMKVAAFIFDQETPRRSAISNHLVTVDQVEARSGLDFMHELPPELELKVEAVLDTQWVMANF